MLRRAKPILADLAARGEPAEQAWALLELGRPDQAEAALAGLEPASAPAVVLAAGVAIARGELLHGLRLLEIGAPEERPARARLLGWLGHAGQGIELLEEDPAAEAGLVRAELHLLAGEPSAASVALPAHAGAGERPEAEPEALGERARWLVRTAAIRLVRGEVLLACGAVDEALAALAEGRDLAVALASPALLARAWSRLGEAHAAAGHRWRALRAVTHGLDRVAEGGVPLWLEPGIEFRAFEVYGRYGHRDRAEAALRTAHQRVIQLASGIDQRPWREAFLIDNPENQRVIGAWKGETSWGYDLSR